jgi:hypothetical protein
MADDELCDDCRQGDHSGHTQPHDSGLLMCWKCSCLSEEGEVPKGR